MTEDPFAHLHDESYGRAFGERRATYADAVHMGGRRTISLDGDWHFTPDLFDEGLRQRWFEDNPDPPSQWTKPRDAEPWEANTLAVPSCWTMVQPEWRHFEGGAWYARAFEWSPETAPRLVLRIGAANYEARVFLNGVFLCSHRGGSTPVFVELTDQVQPGTNRLMIQVDNRRRPDRVPMDHFDWFNHGGIYREVELLPLPAVFVRSFRLDLSQGGLRADLRLSDPAAGMAHLEIPELGIRVAFAVSEGRGEAVVHATPERWSPDRPRLYDVVLSFGEDRVSDRIGFRTIEVRGEEILLNGASLYLRGVCVHEDDEALGKMSTEEDVRRLIRDAQELGCNFLRLAHYPHHERVGQIADELGMLLWEEIPVYWAIDFSNPETYADAENQLLELVARDANRASVVMWGVGNENVDIDARFAFMSRLAEAARAADPTRLVAAACLINRDLFRIEDRLAEHLDVVGLNEYFGWYEPGYDGLQRLLANSSPGRPVIVSETGADALAGHHGDIRQLFTEECQAEVYRQQIALVSQASYVRGFCPWLLYDFRSERRQTRFQQGFNRKGLIAQDKATRKLAFKTLADWYASLRWPAG